MARISCIEALAAKQAGKKVQPLTTPLPPDITTREFRTVLIADLGTDDTYQRGIRSKYKTIASSIDANALGIPLVAEREDGSLWVVDGHQRIAALIQNGYESVTVEIVKSTGPASEAALFTKINRNRTAQTPAEFFTAEITAGNPTVIAIKACVEANGFRLAPASSDSTQCPESVLAGPALRCYAALMRIGMAKGYGVSCIDFALQAINLVWPNNQAALAHPIIMGLAVFYRRFDAKIDMKRFARNVGRERNPDNIIYTARSNKAIKSAIPGEKAVFSVADVIEELYEYRVRADKRRRNRAKADAELPTMKQIARAKSPADDSEIDDAVLVETAE